MSKRFFVVGLVGIFLIGLMGSVLADDVPDATKKGATAVIGFFQGIWQALLGTGLPATRIFMSVLLGMIVYSIISSMKFTQKAWINWAMAIAITSLAMVGIPQELVEVLLTQYGAMGATILTIIPFLIVFIFTIRVDSLLVAKITWVFYCLYYFAMYIYKMNSDKGSALDWVAIIAGVVIFFIIPTIRNFMFKGLIAEQREKGNQNTEERKTLLELEMDRLKQTATS